MPLVGQNIVTALGPSLVMLKLGGGINSNAAVRAVAGVGDGRIIVGTEKKPPLHHSTTPLQHGPLSPR